MTIDPRRYAKSQKVAPIMFNIRLSRRGEKPTADEVTEVLQYILDTGEVPDGWKFAFINWQHGRPPASDNWRTGRLVDMENLAAPIKAAIYSARIAVVRKGAGEDADAADEAEP